MNTPLVTVLFPVFNAQDFLQEALDSILTQTYENLEVLAINDGSTDSSLKILESCSDPRLVIEQNEQNLGLIGTLNKGIPLAKGKYIVRADADDLCLPKRVEHQVQFMETNPDVGISGTGFGTFGEGMELTEKGSFSGDHDTIRFKHLYQIHLMHGTSIWRKSVFEEHGLRFDPEFKHAEDYDLFERASQVTKLGNIPDVLYHVRVRDDSVSYQFKQVQDDNSSLIKKRSFGRIGTNLSDSQLELFRDLCHQDYQKLSGAEEDIADMLVSIISANEQSNYFKPIVLLSHLKPLWLGLTLQNIGSSRTMKNVAGNHAVNGLIPLSVKEKLKVKAKSWMN